MIRHNLGHSSRQVRRPKNVIFKRNLPNQIKTFVPNRNLDEDCRLNNEIQPILKCKYQIKV